MLRYLANGYRQINDHFHPNWRANWEFFAVTEGRVAPLFEAGAQPALEANTLWVFAPECCHGWVAAPRTDFHRISLHFGHVPAELETFVRARGNWFSIVLTAGEAARVREIANELEPHFLNPTDISPLVFQARLLDLSLMLLAGRAGSATSSLHALGAYKVENAISWYEVNLCRAPSIRQVAGAIHVSPSHLRRLFLQVKKKSPKEIFQQLRLEKAQELMNRSTLTLDQVARHCGFASASHLCRDYRRVHGMTPTFWRKKLVVKFSPETGDFAESNRSGDSARVSNL